VFGSRTSIFEKPIINVKDDAADDKDSEDGEDDEDDEDDEDGLSNLTCKSACYSQSPFATMVVVVVVMVTIPLPFLHHCRKRKRRSAKSSVTIVTPPHITRWNQTPCEGPTKYSTDEPTADSITF